MAAFLPTPPTIPLNAPGARSPLTSLTRAARPRAARRTARVHVSATTDEEVRTPDNFRAPSPDLPDLPDLTQLPPTDVTDIPDALTSSSPPSSSARTPAPSAVPTMNGPPSRRSDPRGRPPLPPFEFDPEAVYYTRCGACTAVYEVNPKDLGRGCRVGCEVCKNIWFQKPERLLKLNKENEKFIDYPREKREELMANAAQNRRERSPRSSFRDGPDRRQFRDRSDRPDRGDRAERFDRSDRPPRPNGDRGGDRRGRGQRTGFSVFIGNIPYAVTDEEINELVVSFLPGVRVSIIKDQETGQSKGFAFCDVGSEEEVERAVELLDGQEIKGRNIQVRPGRKNPSR